MQLNKVLMLVFLILFAAASTAAADGDVTLAWAPNSEADLAGYRLHYRTGSGGAPYEGTGLDQGDSPIKLPLDGLNAADPQIEISGLAPGDTYYFVLTAYNAAGDESPYSNEVGWRMPDPPAAPVLLNLTATSIVININTSP